MNAHSLIDAVETNMTSQGFVLIPKAIRDHAGFKPNATVKVGLNEHGEVVVIPLGDDFGTERVTPYKAAIEAMRGTLKTGFATTDDYMDAIRPHRREGW